MSLVLLTSTSADTQFYRERQAFPKVPYRGVQVLNTHDHTHGMNETAAALIEARYRGEAHVLLRRYFNPGFEASISCYALPARTKDAAPAVPRRFTVRGAVALGPAEAEVTKLKRARSLLEQSLLCGADHPLEQCPYVDAEVSKLCAASEKRAASGTSPRRSA